MAKIPEFHFDYSAVEGKDLTEAVEALFGQLEAHYNRHIKPAPILFGGKSITAPVFKQEFPSTPKQAEMVDPDKIAAKPAPAQPAGPVDTETVTPKTVNMKSFAIKDGKELGLKEGDAMLKGITDKGVEVFDKLLPGYDQPPYGPIVQGESGRYNLNPKGK